MKSCENKRIKKCNKWSDYRLNYKITYHIWLQVTTVQLLVILRSSLKTVRVQERNFQTLVNQK